MSMINLISENESSTVITNFKGIDKTNKTYQSEAQLENEFINTLLDEGYDRLFINSEDELINNLRVQLEKLNRIKFTNKEWNYLFDNFIANKNKGIYEKAKLIQEDYIIPMTLDNGTMKNIYLLDKENVHNNFLQVLNQYVNNEGNHDNRYDVTVLVNGLPLVHIELKKRGKSLREAFNQIDRYQRDSFWAGCGLYEFVQIFVISNGTRTKYYSNTTRDMHINAKNKKVANTFEFTSYWADQNNNAILDLIDFAKTFFAKHTILNIICKYSVFSTDNILLAMRPYQIVATEKIINKIQIAYNYKYYGSIKAGGYVWHTTGSGKTLTSFKTSQLASKLDFIDKVLFVVDRKDLDYQAMKEYNKFKDGCANSNSSTKILENQLSDPNAKIIITTIQKLSSFIKKNQDHPVFDKHIVFIFDECHRSQFGEMHQRIIKKFKKYYIFGFTGTPIFASNAMSKNGIMQTTEQTFGEKLHTYTIVNAINDKNVLPFKYDYVKTIVMKNDIKDEKIAAIAKAKALEDKQRIALITQYIIDHFGTKTYNTQSYVTTILDNVEEVAKSNNANEIKQKRFVNGFNSIFAAANITMAKMYYQAFKEIPNNLKVALIYSYGVNDEETQYFDEENPESTEQLSKPDRDYLEDAIKDYNKMFGTSYDTSSDKFQNYYKDVSLRMKNREIDLLIVANMFLTGFDAPTLNTLWVDKNLKFHGLIQSFSRTNRILNSVKQFGNIVCFRDLEKELNEALGLFGDSDASSIVLLKTYEEYLNGFYDEKNVYHKGYLELLDGFRERFNPGEQIIGEQNQKDFVKMFGAILKARNILFTFDKFVNDDPLLPRDEQDYRSIYVDLYQQFRDINKSEQTDINDDLVFEMELVKQIEVNVDYILNLIQKYHDGNMQDKEILITINKAITSSPDLRNKKDLIEAFIESLDGTEENIYNSFSEFMNSKKKEELDKIIAEENLDKDKTYRLVKNSFDRGKVETNGTEMSDILPPISRFDVDSNREEKKNIVISKILEFFNRFFGV